MSINLTYLLHWCFYQPDITLTALRHCPLLILSLMLIWNLVSPRPHKLVSSISDLNLTTLHGAQININDHDIGFILVSFLLAWPRILPGITHATPDLMTRASMIQIRPPILLALTLAIETKSTPLTALLLLYRRPPCRRLLLNQCLFWHFHRLRRHSSALSLRRSFPLLLRS